MSHFSNRERLFWVAALGAALGLVLASFRLPGGDDLYRYYLPFEQGCLDCGFVPYYAQWFLLPLRALPDYPLAWGVWSIVSVTGFLSLAYFTRVNPLFLLVSFPMLGQIWLGQVDVLVAFGLVIFLFAKNPYLRGVGIILALSKPQLTFIPIAFGLLLESPRLWLKLMLVPVAVLGASLLAFGWAWPLYWIKNAASALPVHVWRLASLDVWRFGVFLVPLPLLFKDKRQRLTAGLLLSALATPFYGVYSYVLFLLFENKWWMLALSYIWMLGFFFWQESAMRLAWILPLGSLAWMVYQNLQERRAGQT